MKKILYSALFAFAAITASAQCNQYFVLQEGSEWEYHTHNPKGKLTGKNQQQVVKFSKTGSGYVAKVNSTVTDEKGKELMKGNLEFKCENGTLLMDMRNFISQEQMQAFSSYEMNVEASNLEIPSSLSVGDKLGDGSLTITAKGTPFPMKLTVTISDRKVEGKETITTPAGTFECFKITSKMTMENQMGMKITTQMVTNEWIAPKVGTVKSESFNKNGKSTGYTILAKRTN